MNAIQKKRIKEDVPKLAIGLGIGLVMLFIFISIAFGVFYGTNTTTITNTSGTNTSVWVVTPWNSQVVTLWGYIPIVAIAVAISAVAGYAIMRKDEL